MLFGIARQARSTAANQVCCYGKASVTPRWSRSSLYRDLAFHRPTRYHFRIRYFSTYSETDSDTASDFSATPREKSVEEQYSRKSPLEHVLLRPGMYVGPVERSPPQMQWVLDPTPEPNDFDKQIMEGESVSSTAGSYRMISKEYGTIPALIKIFDEILVNASDNRIRNPDTCTTLDIRIDPGSEDREPTIRIWNNGKGIPIQIHADENMYVPEMLFGHLLTGSNFDDDEKRLTGGRHGYGAKLANIFSKRFTVETVDTQRQLRYQQTWQNNMSSTSPPEITPVDDDDDTNVEDFTCVTFVPDMSILGANTGLSFINQHDYAIMCRRVIDSAGCAGGTLRVFLNGYDVSLNSFADYSGMYRSQQAPRVCYTDINSRWTVGVGLSEQSSFESVSFVNSMSTNRGGTHVDAIVSQVISRIREEVVKLEPDLVDMVNPSMIRRTLFVSVNALIENPIFDSQMKEYLTSNPSDFGSSSNLSPSFLDELVEAEEDGGPGIVEEVVRAGKGRQQSHLFKQVSGKKTRKQLLSIFKLEDAHSAGSENSSDCTLILTEGDSAKALAVAGMEIIGRQKYGVFPLRGKLLNVRHATVNQLAKNAEIKAMVAILGLDFQKTYASSEERNELRYGQVMLMTDQDTDGSHIKGLVINFFRFFWPNILKPPKDDPLGKPFLSSFVTPLLKATRKKEEISFYSMADFRKWQESIGDPKELKQWKIKHYKGLGTSTPAEAKVYFSQFDTHYRPFLWSSENDGELLDKVFDKHRAADRRDWITHEYDPEATLDFSADHVSDVRYEDFVNKEMIHFSNADNVRSLPSVIDGLKPSQRKVLYACFKRKLNAEVKVAQLSGFCAEHTAYHHGEQSLQGTIIGMAQDFVGSNNLNLLVPSGQFGTRLTGGDDAASPRYIFTYLSPVTRYLFPEDDDVLLEYLQDDGQMIEPRFYCPIIPLLLVNGSQGIGTGWSTSIPPHDPMSVLDYVRAKLEKQLELPSIEPYARGFRGTFKRLDKGNGYETWGTIEKIDDRTVQISELPLGVWTDTYKTRLLRMQSKGDVSDFVEDHTTTKVSFRVKLKASQLRRMETSSLASAFRLKSSHPLTNMNAFDESGQIQKFTSAEAIADAHFPIRMSLYEDRKSVLQSKMEYTAAKQRNKARFIQMVSDGEFGLIGGQVSKSDASQMLFEKGFSTAADLDVIRTSNSLVQRRKKLETVDEDDSENQPHEEAESDFDYLLQMPLFSLTKEKIESLNLDAKKIEDELNIIRGTKPEELWMNDLEKLAKHL